MNELQSKINAAEARINQLKNSELFTETDKLKLLPKAEKELEQLLLEKATDIVAKSTIDSENFILDLSNEAGKKAGIKFFTHYNDSDTTEIDKKLKAIWERNGSNRNSI